MIRLEYSCAAGIRMYVDGERIYGIAEINTDESRGNLVVKRDRDAIYAEFEADVEWGSENGNKKAYLTNIREVRDA